jgi:protocatechuate 3,4-dioxygenase alpha subunit
MPPATPSQTVGPYFRIGLSRRPSDVLAVDGPVRVEGRVLDGAGDPVPDAMVEIWQADESGSYRAGFGWGRSETDDAGRYGFTTVRPGPVEGQAPHLVVLVFGRGLLKPCLTRMYFPDEEANDADPVLSALDERDRATLVAVADGGRLRFDIRLQGEAQTAFFTM